MKYLKLFENWLNEDNQNKDALLTLSKIFKDSGLQVGGQNDIVTIYSNQIPLGDNVSFSFGFDLLDNVNPSNKSLKDGITLKTALEGTNQYAGGRWTLNPMSIINCKIPLAEAQQVKSIVETKFKEYLQEYGFLTFVGGDAGYELMYNGKYGHYWEDGRTSFKTKDMKKAFSKEEIAKLKKNIGQGRVVLEKILKEIESVGKNLFAFEIKNASSLPSSYKLASASSKDQYSVFGGSHTESTESVAKYIQEKLRMIHQKREIESEIQWFNDQPDRGRLNNYLYVAISYALGKATFIETLYKSEKNTLAIAGIYANTENKYLAEIKKSWPTIEENIRLAYGLPMDYDMKNYTPGGFSTERMRLKDTENTEDIENTIEDTE